MKISRNWLQTYFDKPMPSAEKLAELFTFHTGEVEGVEKAGNDDVLDIKILPDRAHYALSHQGIALEVSVLTKSAIKDRRAEDVPADLKEAPKIKIEDSNFCRRYIGRYADVPGKKVNESATKGIREQLGAIGQRAISPIVDATNYVMFDVGQPLHAFDADKIKGDIVVRAAKPGEKIAILDAAAGSDRTIELLPGDYVIADDEGPIAIAGVKGGKRAAISPETRRIMIESANFDPASVRRTATRLDLRSESSKRFENEITPEMALLGMNNVSALIHEAMPEAKFGKIEDAYPSKAKQTEFEFDPAMIENRLGISVPMNESKEILERMGIKIEQKKDKWKLLIPFERFDLAMAEDVVEEVGRVYGYEHIKGILPPKIPGAVKVLPAFYLTESIKNVLAEQGFSEVSLYSLVEKGDIEVSYPLARDKAFARKDLASGIMSCLEKNTLNADLLGLEAVKIFEIGHVFKKEGESLSLSIGVSQVKKVKGIKADGLLKEIIKKLSENIGTEIPEPKIISNGNMAVCEVDLSRILEKYDLPKDASYKDLNLNIIGDKRFEKFSAFPFMVRDIAVFVPESLNSDQVWQAIEKGIKAANAGDLLTRHALFDTFKKDGKISYAFRMVFQSMDRTLTDHEATSIMEKIYVEMKSKGWEVR